MTLFLIFDYLMSNAVPCVVMCDKDVLMDIGRGNIKYEGANVEPSYLIKITGMNWASK